MNTKLPSASTASAGGKIIQLRALLAERFPEAQATPGAHWETGVPMLDRALEGGLPVGAMVELVGEQLSAGASSLVRGVVAKASAHGRWAALIDGLDSFDPHTLESRALRRLLWVRCHTAGEAMQSADLLLRDGNLPLVFLDLRSNPAAELRRVPSQSWYRLQRILEPTATALLVLTPFPLIPCAEVRLHLQARFSLAALEEERGAVLARLGLRVSRRRRSAAAPEKQDRWAAAG